MQIVLLRFTLIPGFYLQFIALINVSHISLIRIQINLTHSYQNEQKLRELVAQYGEGKWTKIAQALQIHGIHVPKANSLRYTWDRMNPIGQIWKLNDQEISKLLLLGIQYDADVPKIVEEWNRTSETICEVQILQYTYWKNLKHTMSNLAIIFCRKKKQEKKYFQKMRFVVFRKFLKAAHLKSDDEFTQEISKSAMMMKELIKVYAVNRTLERALQYEEYIKITTKRQFELAVEHFKYVDLLKKIQDKTYFQDKDIVGKCKFQAPTIEQNKKSTLYQQMHMKKNWRNMYEILLKTKDELSAEFLYNPLEDYKQGGKANTKVKMNQQVQKVSIPKVKTLRGRINMPNKTRYSSIYSDQFNTDLLNDLNEQESPVEEFDVAMFETQLSKNQIMENEIRANPNMKEYIDNYVNSAKEIAYLQFKKTQDNTEGVSKP